PRPLDRLERHLIAANEHGNAFVIRKWSRRRCGSVLPTPFWRLLDQRVELLAGAAGRNPVAHIALVRHFWPVLCEIELADTTGNANQCGTYIVGMLVPRWVIVDKDDDVGTAQEFGIFRLPIARAPRVGCRYNAQLGEVVGIPLALRDRDQSVLRHRL